MQSARIALRAEDLRFRLEGRDDGVVGVGRGGGGLGLVQLGEKVAAYR